MIKFSSSSNNMGFYMGYWSQKGTLPEDAQWGRHPWAKETQVMFEKPWLRQT